VRRRRGYKIWSGTTQPRVTKTSSIGTRVFSKAKCPETRDLTQSSRRVFIDSKFIKCESKVPRVQRHAVTDGDVDMQSQPSVASPHHLARSAVRQPAPMVSL